MDSCKNVSIYRGCSILYLNLNGIVKWKISMIWIYYIDNIYIYSGIIIDIANNICKKNRYFDFDRENPLGYVKYF